MIDPKVKEAWRLSKLHKCLLTDPALCTLQVLRDAFIQAEAMRRKTKFEVDHWECRLQRVYDGLIYLGLKWDCVESENSEWHSRTDDDWRAEVQRELSDD